jgi:hypothetical protein
MKRVASRGAHVVALACLVAASSAAIAAGIPDGTKVRIIASGLGDGWLGGKLQMNKSSGCTMVHLDRQQPGGYTMVALNSVRRIERQDQAAWVDVPVQPLLATEKKECREAAND